MIQPYSGPIIDFHTHPFVNEGQNICFYKKDNMASTFEEYMADLERCGISYFAGTPIQIDRYGERPTFEEIRKLNDETLELRERSKGKYIPGFHVHPAYYEQSLKEIRRMEAEGVGLVGELVPYLMGWNEYSYCCPEVRDLYQAAGEANMVVSLHSDHQDEMDILLDTVKNTIIIGAHPGDKVDFYRHIERMKRCPNYYLDICGATGVFRTGMMREAINIVGADRIVYGSDYPVCTPGGTLGAVFFEKLTEEEFSKVLYENAARLLKL